MNSNASIVLRKEGAQMVTIIDSARAIRGRTAHGIFLSLLLTSSVAACQTASQGYPPTPEHTEYSQFVDLKPSGTNMTELKPVGLQRPESGISLDLLVVSDSAESWAYQIGGVSVMNDTKAALITLTRMSDHKIFYAFAAEIQEPYKAVRQWNPAGSGAHVGARDFAVPPLVLSEHVAVERIPFKINERLVPGEYEVRLADGWTDMINGQTAGGAVFKMAKGNRVFKLDPGPVRLTVR